MQQTIDGEEEVILGPWPCRCKKKDGKLSLTVNKLVHHPDDGGPAIIVDLREVQTRQFSLLGNAQAKAVIKLTQISGETIFVELTSGEERWAHQGTLVKWMSAREEEMQVLEEATKKEAELLGSRMQAVMGCRELREEFSYLVKQKQALSHSEFFKAHAQEISMLMPLPKAHLVDLAALRPAEAAAKGTRPVGARGALPAEESKRIFAELPELEKLYGVSVPSLMNAAQFWERCLASRYYLELTGHQVPPGHPADPVFDALNRSVGTSANADQPTAHLQTAAEGALDPEADLTGEPIREQDRPSGRPGQRRGGLLEQLNERSAAALAALLSGSGGAKASNSVPAAAAGAAAAPAEGAAGEGAAEDLARRVERRREALKRAANALRDELDGGVQPRDKAARLQLQPGAGPLRAPPPEAAAARELGAVRSAAGGLATGSATDAMRELLTAWGSERSDRHLAEPSVAGAKWLVLEATNEMLQADRFVQSAAPGAAELEPPRDVAEVMAHAQALLRHFWGSRWGEADLRGRLARELRGLLASLERWEAERQAGRSSDNPPARRAARSFAAPIRRALRVYEGCCARK